MHFLSIFNDFGLDVGSPNLLFRCIFHYFSQKYDKILENVLPQQFRQHIHYHADTQSMIVEVTLTIQCHKNAFIQIYDYCAKRFRTKIIPEKILHWELLTVGSTVIHIFASPGINPVPPKRAVRQTYGCIL